MRRIHIAAGAGLLTVCAPLAAQSYYFSDNFTPLNSSNWVFNGTATNTFGTGLESNYYGYAPGSAISRLATPGGNGDVLARITVHLVPGYWPANTYAVLVRATPDAITAVNGPDAGTFYAFALNGPNYPGPTCSAGVRLYKRVGGVVTTLAQFGYPCHDGMILQMAAQGNQLLVSIDTTRTATFTDSDITGGAPGASVVTSTGASSVSYIQLGAAGPTPPGPPGTPTLSAFPNHVDLQWAAAHPHTPVVG